jgi:hypothetical protein
MTGIVLAVPVAAQIGVVPDHFADESATQPTQLAMTELQDQNTAPRQEPSNKYTAGSGDKQPASAGSSDNACNNSSVSSAGTKEKKKNTKKGKSQAKPASSDQEEEFNRVLRGIYG